MYPIEVVEDYLVLHHADAGWDEVLDRREATAVLWRDDALLGRALADDPALGGRPPLPTAGACGCLPIHAEWAIRVVRPMECHSP